MTNIYETILRAPDGRERHELAWFPTAATRKDYIDRARKHGLEIEIKKCNPQTSVVFADYGSTIINQKKSNMDKEHFNEI